MSSSEPPEIVFPEDVAACHALISELTASIAELKDQNLAHKLEIEYLIKLAFRRRSERYVESPDQLKLDLGESDEVLQAVESLKDAKADLEQEQQSGEPDKQTTASTGAKPKKRPRQEHLPAHLPRHEVVVEATDEQRHCAEHGERKVIGYDRTETLKLTPPKLWVCVMLYPKFACEGAPQCGVQSPARAPGLVEGNRYDTSVAAEIITNKYDYHLPAGTAALAVVAAAGLLRRQRLDSFAKHAAESLGLLGGAAGALGAILRRLRPHGFGGRHGRHGRDAAVAQEHSAHRSFQSAQRAHSRGA